MLRKLIRGIRDVCSYTSVSHYQSSNQGVAFDDAAITTFVQDMFYDILTHILEESCGARIIESSMEDQRINMSKCQTYISSPRVVGCTRPGR